MIYQLIIGILCIISALARASDYPIQLSQSLHNGDTLEMSATVKYEFLKRYEKDADNRRQVRVAFVAAIEGSMTIIEASKNGAPANISIKLGHLTKNGQELLSRGDIVLAENVNGVTQFKVNNQIPNEEIRQALTELVYTSGFDEPSADEKMGTKDRKKVGETWTVDRHQLAKSGRRPFQVEDSDYKGEGKLEKVGEVAGTTAETISIWDSCEFGKRVATDGSEFKDLKMRSEFSIVLPIDDLAKWKTSRMNQTDAYTIITPQDSFDIKIHRLWETTLKKN